MLVPQFSLRWLFAITALCAGVFSIVAFGVRGHRWAMGVTVAIVALVILMLVHAALFGIVWLFTSLAGRGRDKSGQPAGSPFAPTAPTSGERESGSERPAVPILLDQE